MDLAMFYFEIDAFEDGSAIYAGMEVFDFQHHVHFILLGLADTALEADAE